MSSFITLTTCMPSYSPKSTFRVITIFSLWVGIVFGGRGDLDLYLVSKGGGVSLRLKLTEYVGTLGFWLEE